MVIEYPCSSGSSAKNSLIREQNFYFPHIRTSPCVEPVLDLSCHGSLACEDIQTLHYERELRIVEQSETPNLLIADP
jgi:hypothetical protein